MAWASVLPVRVPHQIAAPARASPTTMAMAPPTSPPSATRTTRTAIPANVVTRDRGHRDALLVDSSACVAYPGCPSREAPIGSSGVGQDRRAQTVRRTSAPRTAPTNTTTSTIPTRTMTATTCDVSAPGLTVSLHEFALSVWIVVAGVRHAAKTRTTIMAVGRSRHAARFLDPCPSASMPDEGDPSGSSGAGRRERGTSVRGRSSCPVLRRRWRW